MSSKIKIVIYVVACLAAITGFAMFVSNRAQNVKGTVQAQGDIADVQRDPEVAAAVIQQQKTLDEFIKRLQNPEKGDKGFGVNAKMTANGRVEQIWVNVDGYSDGMFAGRLANEPRLVKGLKKGDPVMVKKEEVSDWIYFADGKQVGGLVMEAIRRRLGR